MAATIGVTTQIVFDWKRKTKTPGERNSAKMLEVLLKTGPTTHQPFYPKNC